MAQYGTHLTSYNTYEQIKDRLRIVLCDFHNIETYKNIVVHTLYVKWCSIYCFNHTGSDEKKDCEVITYNMLSMFGIDELKLHSDAVRIENECRPVQLFGINCFPFWDMNGGNKYNLFGKESIADADKCTMYVLTHQGLNNGASVIARDGVMEKVGRLIGSNYYVIPSSVHELIIVPDDGSMCNTVLKDIVFDINNTIVDENDCLSYTVQYYNRETGALECKE